MVAPFERGRDHGGSQRATAMAERLEERGAEVTWGLADARLSSPVAKLRAAASLTPALVDIQSHNARGIAEIGGVDAAIAAHSYLAGLLEALDPSVVRATDFHNLEWRHLADAAHFEPPPRRLYAAAQVRLMKRFERRVIRRMDLATFVSRDEIEWARAAAPGSKVLLVPSVLPEASERAASELSRRRRGRGSHELVYVGTLTFPSNVEALKRFLRELWPRLREELPRLRLTVAGAGASEDLRYLDSFEGVHAAGFVEDTAPLLERAAAVILPISGRAGTSLRALFYSLAGIWVIGTPEAFRGLPWHLGTQVETGREWTEAVRDAVEHPERHDARISAARAAALALQGDGQSWDEVLAGLARPTRHTARRCRGTS